MIDFLLAVPGKLKTVVDHLTTYLSSTRCAKIDNLDAAMSTRAPSSTALSTATWTGTKAGYLDMAISGVARIKSIQRVTIVLSGTTSGDYTITAVVLAKTIIIPSGESTTGTDYTTPDARGGKWFLSSTTNINLSRGNSTGALSAYCYVVEFY